METSPGVRPVLDPVRCDGTVACVWLPARPGRVTRLSTPGELAALPGVTEVSMLNAEGDLISAPMSSAHVAGLVFVTAPTPDDVDALIRGGTDR
ncbi:hypothetical protein [Streptomyces sp. GESEQ-35]|uniref:hypothetical protein n=1 Tax=Streptomyces sp. GESEQ-35 TaxID=2812657 RepID=UPI001B32719D|nr:hypothetical protein [Streptomyces sp. GESEQ-35]